MWGFCDWGCDNGKGLLLGFRIVVGGGVRGNLWGIGGR